MTVEIPPTLVPALWTALGVAAPLLALLAAEHWPRTPAALFEYWWSPVAAAAAVGYGWAAYAAYAAGRPEAEPSGAKFLGAAWITGLALASILTAALLLAHLFDRWEKCVRRYAQSPNP